MIERLKQVVWNEHSRRPRLPWRLTLWLVLLVVLILVATTVIDLLTSASIERLLGTYSPGKPSEQTAFAARNVVSVASQVILMVGSVYLAGRFVDRRWFRDFGFHLDREWWLDLGFGLALGAVLMTVVFVVELLAGWLSITELFFIARSGFSFWPWFLWGFVTFVAIGVYEELVFRGYLVTNLSEGWLWFDRVNERAAIGIATLLTSAVFGIAHAGNPNATLASTVGIFLAAFMLAVGYVLTGELAIPIGLHTTWNFFQGTVFGFPVSGMDFGVSLVAIEQSGPTLLTGGAFGPEAGLVGIGASVFGLGLTILWVRWRTGTLRFDRSLTEPELRHR